MSNTIIKKIISSAEHPISGCPLNVKIIYLNGLVGALSVCSCIDTETKRYLKELCTIIGIDYESIDFVNIDYCTISKAINIRSTGFHLKDVRVSFWIDFYIIIIRRGIAIGTVHYPLYPYMKSLGTFSKVYYAFMDGNINDIKYWLYNEKVSEGNSLEDKKKTILVVAKVSSGKSTLINALAGNIVCRATQEVCTNKISKIFFTDKQKCRIVRNGKEEIVDTLLNSDHRFDYDEIYLPGMWGDFCMIDTPGVNNSLDKSHEQMTWDYVKSNDYDILLYVCNVNYCANDDEARTLQLIKKLCKKKILFVVNQIDTCKTNEGPVYRSVQNFKDFISTMGFHNNIVIPIASRPALLLKIGENNLERMDRIDLELFKDKLEDSSFDFSSFVDCTPTNALEATYIPYLETEIKKQIL